MNDIVKLAVQSRATSFIGSSTNLFTYDTLRHYTAMTVLL